MRWLPDYTALEKQVGGFHRGSLILVMGELSLPFVMSFTALALKEFPDAMIVSNHDGIGKRWIADPRRLRRYVKIGNVLGVVLYDFAWKTDQPATLQTVRKTLGCECEYQSILLVMNDRAPFKVEVAKARGGTYGTVLVEERLTKFE